MNKNLIKNKSGNTNIIILSIFIIIMGFGTLLIGNYVYYAIASNADAGTLILTHGVASSGTITFSGNVSNGDMVNITNGGLHMYEFNSSNPSPSVCQMTGCTIVNVYNTNNSTQAAINLTNVINADATINSIVTAVYTTNTSTITYKVTGTAGNSVAIAESGLNTVTSGTTLTGGINEVSGQSSQNTLNSYVEVVLPLFGLVLMVLGFGVLFMTLRKSFGSGEVR